MQKFLFAARWLPTLAFSVLGAGVWLLADEPTKPRRKPVTLEATSAAATAAANNETRTVAEQAMSVLQPLQVLLGNWRGTTRKALLDQPAWAWDFQTDPAAPALAMQSPQGKYVKSARLTWDPAAQKFRLQIKDGEGLQRLLVGELVEPVQQLPDDGDRLQTTFKLELTQAEPDAQGEVWKITLAQQSNDRYLLELNRKRGTGAFQRVDTVNTMRMGATLAQVREDYGDKTCIISGGLGTIEVKFQGRSYWVCCTGCQAAFDENPKKWIARYDEQQAELKKKGQ